MAQAQQPREYTTTRWKNENPFPQVVTLDGIRYVWQPDDVKEISSQYDGSIHTIHGGVTQPDGRIVGGAIVGGLAPKLTNLSVKEGDRATLHESLDPDVILKNEAEAAALLAARDAQNAATLATIAQSKVDQVKPNKGK
jgi:hypothetical protein